jgi:hypothetical protein
MVAMSTSPVADLAGWLQNQLPTPAAVRDAAVVPHKSNGERSALVLVQRDNAQAGARRASNPWQAAASA